MEELRSKTCCLTGHRTLPPDEAAQCILRLRASYPAIRLILVLPCRDQARGWPLRDKFIYLLIKRQADKLVYTAQCYEPGCMQKRNRHLVAHSSCCLCYLTSRTGGTAYTVACAKRAGLTVLNISAPLTLPAADAQRDRAYAVHSCASSVSLCPLPLTRRVP